MHGFKNSHIYNNPEIIRGTSSILPTKSMTSETVGKRFHLKYALVFIVLNIYMLPHLDAVILKFEYLPTNKSESSVMITIPHIYVVRAYSLKGKFYTQFLSCTTGTAFLVSPSNFLIQLVKYCIA